MTANPRQSFERMWAGPEDRIDLARAALLVAAEEYEALDVDGYLARLDELAGAARARVEVASDTAERVVRLNQFLFVEQGFQGNRADYYDPRNSYLNDVLDRRTGIPITLSLVYVEVARRLGLRADGVGFPGHFLTRVVANPDLIVDPFGGGVVSEEHCRQRLEAMAGPDAVLDPGVHLRAASPREVVVRLLGNLKQLFAEQGDLERALACCDRILIVGPDAPNELLDRGLLYEKLECHAAAAADLERFLELVGDHDAAVPVARRLAQIRRKRGPLH